MNKKQKNQLMKKILLASGTGILLFGVFSFGVFAATNTTKDSGGVSGDYRTKSPMQQLRQWSTLFGTEQSPQNDFGGLKGNYKVKKKFGIQSKNDNPSVEFKNITPENDDFFRTNFAIPFEVLSNDNDGIVKKVEYYYAPYKSGMEQEINNDKAKIDGLVKIGESTTTPFSFTWNTPSKGNLAIIARAIDNNGASGRALLHIYVHSANQPPVVTLIGITDGELMSPPHPIKVEVTVVDPDTDNGIEKIEYFGKTGKILSDMNVSGECLGSYANERRGTGTAEVHVCQGGMIFKKTFTWNAPDHGNYMFRVVATDSERGRSKLSGEKGVRIGVTDPPTDPVVSFPKPQDGFYHRITDTLTIPIQTSDPDGDVVKVEMYRYEQGTRKRVATETNTEKPFTFTLSNHPRGAYYYGFKAFDNDNAESKETLVKGYQFKEQNKAPELVVLSPNDSQVFQENPTIQIKATANDTDGRIKNTQFFLDSESVSPKIEPGACKKDVELEKSLKSLADFDDTLCYGIKTPDVATYIWKPQIGTHKVRIVTTDNEGSAVEKTIAVKINNPPLVLLTAPSASSTHIRPVDIKLAATASDTDGTIAKVQFYQSVGNGAQQLLNEDTTSPYEYTWLQPALNRNVKITARATDNDGATKEVSVGGILVTSKPAVTLNVKTALVHAQGAYAGEFSMSVMDEAGGIKEIELYRNSVDDGNKLANLTIPATGPKGKGTASYTWKAPLVGKYTIIARAKNTDSIFSQAQTNLTVNDPPSGVSISVPAPLDKRYHRTVNIITLSATAIDKDGTISKVEFYRKKKETKNFVRIGEDTTKPYSFGDKMTLAGAYDVKVVATDNNGAQTESNMQTISVREPNKAPTVSITIPQTNSIYQPNTTIALKAQSQDADGTISKVEFFDGANRIGEGTNVNWAPAVGAHTITAKATDDEGVATTSLGITLKVKNDTPTISALEVKKLYQKGEDATLSVTAKDVDSGMDRVEFYNNNQKIKESVSLNGITYSAIMKSLAVGTYKFSAKAFDKINAEIASNTVEVKVNNPPTVSLTSPKALATYITTQQIDVTAGASDSDGSISRVEFYRGEAGKARTKIGDDSTAPFTFNEVISTVGTYDYSARSFDNNIGVSQEAIIKNIRVKEPNKKPSIKFHETQTATYQPGVTLTLKAKGEDSDGSLSKVEFFDGSSKISGSVSVNSGIYSLSWAPALGTHKITVVATDNEKLSTTSDPITITVKNDAPSISALNVQSVYQVGQNISLSVTASDSDSGLSSVKFYQDGKEMKEAISVSGNTYSLTLQKPGVKTYSFYAQATDTIGTTSQTRAVRVKINAAPSVSLTIPRPPDGFYYRTTNTIPLYSSTSDIDGKITKVEFYRGESGKALSLITTRNFPNPQFGDKVDNAGKYDYKVIVTDEDGARVETGITTLEVRDANKAPTLSFTSPKNGDAFTYTSRNTKIMLRASASDFDGSIRNVGFYNGNSSIGNGTLVGSEYQFEWNWVARGDYTIKVKAWDNEGLVSEEKSISIKVEVAPPSISEINASNKTPNANIFEPINFEVNASDTHVDMWGVHFVYKIKGSDALNNIGWIAKPSTGNVYKATWTPVNEGVTMIMARAYNVMGKMTESFVGYNVSTPVPTIEWKNNNSYTIPYNASTVTVPLELKITHPSKTYSVYYAPYYFKTGELDWANDGRGWDINNSRTYNWTTNRTGKHSVKVLLYYWTQSGGSRVIESTMDITITKQPPPQKRPPRKCIPRKGSPCNDVFR